MRVVYPNLRAEMARSGVTAKDIAELLGCAPNTFTNKMSGRSDFTISESDKIHEKHFPQLQKGELFKRAEITAS